MNAKSKNKAALRMIIVSLMLSIGYAVLRYHIVGPVPWKDLPFFILNKGLALCAFILLSITFSLGPLKNMGANIPEHWLTGRKAAGMIAFLLVFIHMLMSFMLFKPEVYAKFFEPDGTVTAFAGISMLGGVLSFVVLWAYNLSFKTFMREDKAFIKFITSRGFLLFAILLGAVHIFFMGFAGWLKPDGWHGGLPPISLIAFTAFVLTFTINLLGRK